VAATLHSFTSSAGDGADVLFRAYQRDGDDGDIASVRDFAGTEMGVLTDLSATAPRSLQSDFAEAAQLLSDLDQQATVLCDDCGPRGPLAAARPAAAGLGRVRARGPARRDTRITTGSTPATGAAPVDAATSAGTATTPSVRRGAPVSTPTRARSALPRLEDLVGAGAPGSSGGRPPRTAPGSDPSSGPLGGSLPTPSVPAPGLPNVGDVTDQVRRTSGRSPTRSRPDQRPKTDDRCLSSV
jgi:hypothetical protein